MPAGKKGEITNPALEAIHGRISVRSYKQKPVPKGIITALIEAGNMAPSRGRQKQGSKDFFFRPGRFVVVEDGISGKC